MSILDEIHNAKINHIRKSGTHPTRVYIGYKTWGLFKEEYDSMLLIRTGPKTGRTQIQGLDVYIVDDKDPLFVC